MATLWRTDGTFDLVEPANGTDFTLAEIRRHVGGYAEVVRLDEDSLMLVNEDGHSLGLSPNEVATGLYDSMARRNGHEDGASGHRILGNVLVCSHREIR